MEAPLTGSGILIRLGIVLLLVLANGFFVAAEFSLVGARRTRIEAYARAGRKRARFAQSALRRLDRYISTTQLGITLASLGLGWVGESTMAQVFMHLFSTVPDSLRPYLAHSLAGILAFACITFLHIVTGELAPKALALLFPDEVALWTAGPVLLISRVAAPAIMLLNGSANLLLKTFGLRAPRELERVHRPEEIEMLLAQSQEHGLMGEEPVEMIRGVFDLSETTVAEVMTPRTDMFALPEKTTVDSAAEQILEEGHSRVPIYGENLDDIVGVVLAWDVWRGQRAGEKALAALIRSVPFVPESKAVEEMLREMQSQRMHIAIVVDEFGGTAGLVTMEDLVEQIVGDIADEDEEGPGRIVQLSPTEFQLEGNVPISELNELFTLNISEEDYTTIGGFVLGSLGRVARVGDVVNFEHGRVEVLETDRRKINRLRLVLRRRRNEGDLSGVEEED